MTPLAPNLSTVYLTSVKYFPEKKEVLIEYSNLREKITQKQVFFPKFYFSLKDINENLFIELLSLYDSRKIRIEKINEIVKVTAKDFTELKKIANLINFSLKKQPLILGPERQFLIENNLSYFDSFALEKNGLKKIESLAIPEIKLEFLTSPLNDSVKELLSINSETTEKLVNSVIYSNLLCMPVNELPSKNSLLIELFLEKMFFKHEFDLSKEEKKEFYSSEFPKNLRLEKDLTEIDFSFVWPTLLSKSFYNIGFESINCKCCKTSDFNAENVLPNSLIEVEFLSEGTYFESNNIKWRKEFHEKRSGKEERLRMQKEFYLNSIPIGPFNKGVKELIPLTDVKNLLKKNQVRILSNHGLYWFCEKREAFLSKEINSLNALLEKVSIKCSEFEERFLKEFNLMSSNKLLENPEFFYLKCLKEVLSELICFTPTHLFSVNSKFYSTQLTEIIKTIQIQTIKEFQEFSKIKGAKFINFNNYKTFINSDSTLKLLKNFSLKQNIPLPKIKFFKTKTHNPSH